MSFPIMKQFTFLFFFCAFWVFADSPSREKILLCGVAKDVAHRIGNAIENMEQLGAYFNDYAVLIYENNSEDTTASILTEWARKNPRVIFSTETISSDSLPLNRTERIARARNQVLTMAKNERFKDFKYLLMADLDFQTPWPIQEILRTIESPREWDAVCANGINSMGYYYDRYAYRDTRYPFGPELLGDKWGDLLQVSPLSFSKEEAWVPVYSAFGGLAIYKTASILESVYSGSVTEELKNYYLRILRSLPKENGHLKTYLKINHKKKARLSKVRIRLHDPGCCEHVSLYASMAARGFGRIYVNPQMVFFSPN